MANRTSLRIVHCVRSPIGGIFRHIADLAMEQARAGHRVGLICDSLTGGPFEDAHIERLRPHLELGVERIPMRREIRPSDIGAAWSVFGKIKAFKPDILHGHGSKGGAYVRLMGTALRLFGHRPARFYCPHGGSLHYDAGTRKGRVLFTLERMMEHLSDGLIFVSHYERDQYCAKVGTPRVPSHIVYNGLNAREFEPVDPASTARDFLFIGMLRDIKGPDVFVRAIAKLADLGIHPTAHIVGDGPDRDSYRGLVDKLNLDGQIAFHDPLPARQAFAMARNVVVPSRGESMPYIVLETIAAQIPIIATRVGGIPEIFGREKSALVEPGDEDALAEAMMSHLDDQAAAGEQARERARRIAGRFSVEHMASMIESAYRSAERGRRTDALRANALAAGKTR